MLSLVTLLLPLVAALVIRIVADRRQAARAALMLSLLPLVSTLWVWNQFDPDGGFQFLFEKPWVAGLGIMFKIGMDGISLLLVLLTNILVPLIIYSSFDRDIRDHRNFYSKRLVS